MKSCGHDNDEECACAEMYERDQAWQQEYEEEQEKQLFLDLEDDYCGNENQTLEQMAIEWESEKSVQDRNAKKSSSNVD